MNKLLLALVAAALAAPALAQTAPPPLERGDRPGITSSTVPRPGAATEPALPATVTTEATRVNRQHARSAKEMRRAEKAAKKAAKAKRKAAKRATKNARRMQRTSWLGAPSRAGADAAATAGRS